MIFHLMPKILSDFSPAAPLATVMGPQTKLPYFFGCIIAKTLEQADKLPYEKNCEICKISWDTITLSQGCCISNIYIVRCVYVWIKVLLLRSDMFFISTLSCQTSSWTRPRVICHLLLLVPQRNINKSFWLHLCGLSSVEVVLTPNGIMEHVLHQWNAV